MPPPTWVGPPAPGAPGRRRPWLPIVVVLAVGAAGLVVWQATSGGSDGGDGGGGGGSDVASGAGWVDSSRENANRLATDGEVVCGTDLRDNLFCVDAGSGDERFTLQLPNHVSSSPALVDGTVLVGDEGTGEDGLYAYSPDGELLWSTDAQVRDRELAALHLPVAGGTAAVIDEGLMGSTQDRLMGVDAATGDVRWRAFEGATDEQPHLSSFTPVLTDGERFYVSLEVPQGDPLELGPEAGMVHAVVAIDPASGEELWRTDIAQGATIFPVITEAAPFGDGSAVAFLVGDSSFGQVVVLDTATGEVRWQVDLATVDTSVAHVDGVTVVADGDELRGYDDQGTEVWSVPAPTTIGLGNLRVHGGRLFAVDYDVYMVDPADGASRLVSEGVSGTDVVVVDDLVIVAGISGLEAVPLAWIEDDEPVEPGGESG